MPQWTSQHLLAQLLLPAYESLASATQQKLLDYIERHWALLPSIRDDDALKAALAATPFVDTGAVRLRQRFTFHGFSSLCC